MPGQHDFAVRKTSFVLRASIAHRKSALRSPRARRSGVHRISGPTYVTFAIRPSDRAGTTQINHISEKKKEEYFCAEIWTGQISLKRLAKFDFARR